MEWIKKLLEKHTKDGKLDTEAFMTEFGTEFAKNAATKALYNESLENIKKLQADLVARDTQLEELKKAAGTSEELKKQIETLQTENKTAKEKFDADLKDLTLTNAIKMAVAGKVHDETLVSGLVDKSKLVIDGDKVVGLEDQLKSLQEAKAFLFKSDGDKGNDGKGGNQNKPGFKVGAGAGETGGGGGQQQPASLRDAIASAMKSQLGKS